MRRSKMVELIYTKLRSSDGHWRDIANEVLQLIEQNGMLPPYNPQHLDHGAMQDCQWTPEETICEIPEYAFKCNNCKCEDN